MIGLLFLTGFSLWFWAAVFLSKKLSAWLGVSPGRQRLVSVVLFPLIFLAPIADDLIGRGQFYRLCEREAVVTLSPDWEKVNRASQKPDSRRELHGYLIPIHAWSGAILDADTGKVFMTSQSFFTEGGFLQRHLYGFNGQATSCHPKDIQAIQKQVNLFELLEQGK